jgi:hypothetical protein
MSRERGAQEISPKVGRLGAKAPTGPKARNPFSSTC